MGGRVILDEAEAEVEAVTVGVGVGVGVGVWGNVDDSCVLVLFVSCTFYSHH